MSDKRIKPRFGPLVLKAQIDTGQGPEVGYLTNVSTGGAFLAMDAPPPIGAELSLIALLPWSLGELRARARVVWRNDPGSPDPAISTIVGAGLAFTRLEEGAEEALDAYLQRFAELAAQLDESPAAHDGH